MQFNIENISELEKKISIEVPSDQISHKVNTKLVDLSKKVKIPGFRPGKIPMDVMHKRYGQDVHQEVLSDVMRDSLQKAFIESKVDPVSMPQIDSIDDQGASGLKFTAKFEVRPEIKFTDSSKLTFERPDSSITDSDIDEMIEKLRKQNTLWEEANEKASDGMKVEVDFVGTIDGVAFDGGTGNSVPFVIGTKSMLDEFEQGVIGLSIDEQKDVPVKFPESYHEKSLAGKQANFSITLRKVFKPKLPEVDAEFLAKLGIKDNDVSKLREKISKNMETELNQRKIVLFQEEVFNKFANANDIPLPNGMVQHEIERLRRMTMDQIRQYGGEPKESDFPKEQFEDKAKEQVKLTLLVTEYIMQNEISVDDQKVSAKIDLIASTYDDSEAVKKWFYSDKDQLDRIKSQVLEEQVVEHIASQSKVKNKNLSYTEIMNK